MGQGPPDPGSHHGGRDGEGGVMAYRFEVKEKPTTPIPVPHMHWIQYRDGGPHIQVCYNPSCVLGPTCEVIRP